MKCPKCKKSLKTKRTFGEISKVKRERFCPKCKEKIWTIELLMEDYAKEIRDLNSRYWNEQNERERIEREYNTLGEALGRAIKFTR